MKREHLAFLFAGFAFGALFGFGAFYVVENRPQLDPAAQTAAGPGGPPIPRGPAAPTQTGPQAQAGAPMVAEVNRLKTLVQQDPTDPAPIVRLAHIYHEAEMWEQAVAFYDRALNLEKEDPDLLTDMGICLRYLQQFDRAMEVFDRAHRSDPNHWQALFNTVIVAAFDLGRFDRALAALESMEAIRPRPAELDEARLGQLREALERAEGSAGANGRS